MTSSSKYFQYFVLLAVTPSTLCFAAAESVHCGVLLCVTVYLCICVFARVHMCAFMSAPCCVFYGVVDGSCRKVQQ